MNNVSVSIKQIKIEANQLKKKSGIQHSKALEIVSQNHGFQNWHHARKCVANSDEFGPLQTRQNFPFRFFMDRKDSNWDFSDNTDSDYIEDDDLFEAIFAFGLKKGLSQQDVYESLEDLIFLRHKFAEPKTPFEAVKIITQNFFFPPFSIWLNGVEYYNACDPDDPENKIWYSESYRVLFNEEEYDFDELN